MTLTTASTAEPLPPNGDALTLREALRRSLAHNPALAAFGHRLAESEGRIQQASFYRNPTLGVESENVAGQGAYRGSRRAETTISIGWAVEPNLRGRRLGIAEAQSARTQLEAEILRLDVAAETALRFLSSLESQAHLEATDEAVALAERSVAEVERRVNAGRSPRAELMRARAELASERLAHDDITHERSVAYHKLAAQWGETAPSFTRVDGALMAAPEVAPFAELVARIEDNPDLARLASEERVAESVLQLAKARRWPTLTPSIGARRFEATGDWALIAGVTVPLGLFDRNQGRVAESRAALARTRADFEAERVRVQTRLYEIYQEMQHNVHRAEVLRTEVVPRLEETLDETRRGYGNGGYRYHELRTAEAQLLAARRSVVEAGAAAHRLVITLERLTGEGIVR